ncbi:hypothetical protein D3C77_683290 [compost metagenome]
MFFLSSAVDRFFGNRGYWGWFIFWLRWWVKRRVATQQLILSVFVIVLFSQHSQLFVTVQLVVDVRVYITDDVVLDHVLGPVTTCIEQGDATSQQLLSKRHAFNVQLVKQPCLDLSF